MNNCISIITPTHNRGPFLNLLWECILKQTHSNWEWLVVDDSDKPCEFMIALSRQNPRVKYWHTNKSVTIGAKRNFLIQQSTGDFIAHFDDDDYYAPPYLELMHGMLNSNNLDLIKLSAFYTYCPELDFFGFLDLNAETGLHYLFEHGKVRTMEFHPKMRIGSDYIIFFGFSYFYTKAIALEFPFQNVSLSEDEHFAKDIVLSGKTMSTYYDEEGIALHLMHTNSTSRCLSRYHMPSFLKNKIFPAHRLPE